MGILSRLFNRKHEWVLIGTSVADPQPSLVNAVSNASPETIEKLLFGVTTYIWEDQATKEIKKTEYLGVEETPLRQLLARADMWGRYEVVVDGDKRYVISSVAETPSPVVAPSSPVQPTPPTLTDISKLPVR